jgi:hypothetical protein
VFQSIKRLTGCRVLATDGEIGHVEDAYFDDEKWIMRYLVVETSGWLSGRRVLIAPYAVRVLDADARVVAVSLTRKQVQDSPDVDTEKPVSRLQEEAYYSYYGYPIYWAHTTNWAWGATPVITPVLPAQEEQRITEVSREIDTESHLRSFREVVDYHLRAKDDVLGHVVDFLFDEDTWAICFLVADPRNWWPGRHVLIRKGLIDAVSWVDRTLSLRLSKEDVRRSRPYDPRNPPAMSAGEPASAARRQHRSH